MFYRWLTLKNHRQLLGSRSSQRDVNGVRGQDTKQLLHRLHLGASKHIDYPFVAAGADVYPGVCVDFYLENKLVAGVQRDVQRVSEAEEIGQRGDCRLV